MISQLRSQDVVPRFLELTRQMVVWLREQPGFLEYALYQQDLEFSDTLVYASDTAAHRITAAFRETEICREMMTLVAPDFRSFYGKRLVLGT